MHRVVVLAIDGVYPFELGMPSRVFLSGPSAGAYEVVTCGVDGGPVRTSADFDIAVKHGPEALQDADTVVIPAFDEVFPTPELPRPLAAAMERIVPGRRIMSICTGAFVLAAAGRLDERPATTHWGLADHFRRWFPRSS